jgi:gp16 family phage-associated protein
MPRKTAVRTAAQARRWIEANGITIEKWSAQQGLSKFAVIDLLRGRRKGLRGDGHRAAIALGMKLDPKDVEL